MQPVSEDDSSSGAGHGHGLADIPDADKDDKADPGPSKRYSWSCIARSAAVLVIVGLAAYIIIDSMTTMRLTRWYETFLEWLRENLVAGALAYALLYIVATVVFFPGSILTLGAGFTFSSALGQGVGIAVAAAVVVAGASIGATLAFLLGRYVLRDSAKAWASQYRILAAVDRAIERSGVRLMLLLRLSPVVPFSAFNYVAAVTGVRLRDFLIAHLALIPGTAAYCYFGSLLSSARETAMGEVQDPVLQWVLLAVGVVATLAALVLITLYARRELAAALDDPASPSSDETAEEDAAMASAAAPRAGRTDELDGAHASAVKHTVAPAPQVAGTP